MNVTLLDGREVREKLLDDLKNKLDKLDKRLGLTVIQIGSSDSSNIYIKQKEKLAIELGYNFNYIKLDDDIWEDDVLSLIDELNDDSCVDGILIQLPIPDNLNSRKILDRISSKKDVDGLTCVNAGRLICNKECLIPGTALGIMDIFSYYNIDVSGKYVVIVGRSDLVGKPMFSMLINKNATVTLCHSKTKNLESITSRADILIVAVGVSKLITRDMVKRGCVIIDAGINVVDGKLCGDVDYDNVVDIVSYITPVPYGVGQVTTVELLYNVYRAYELNKRN